MEIDDYYESGKLLIEIIEEAVASEVVKHIKKVVKTEDVLTTLSDYRSELDKHYRQTARVYLEEKINNIVMSEAMPRLESYMTSQMASFKAEVVNRLNTIEDIVRNP